MNSAFGCINNTIRLRSGCYFDLANPQPDQFTLRDIAGGLSKICRFGGQCDNFYSVAEHSIHCERTAQQDNQPPSVCLAVLFHDAAEAFIGDVVKPLKLMLKDYAEVEIAVERAIGEKFGIDFAAHQHVITEIDHAMLIAERKALFTPDNRFWMGQDECRTLKVQFSCADPKTVELAFFGRAQFLGLGD